MRVKTLKNKLKKKLLLIYTVSKLKLKKRKKEKNKRFQFLNIIRRKTGNICLSILKNCPTQL